MNSPGVVVSSMETVPSVGREDEGKPVYDTEDTRVGMITRVDGDDVYIDPDPELSEKLAARLGWTFMLQGSEETYAIDASDIESVSDDRVTVRVVEP